MDIEQVAIDEAAVVPLSTRLIVAAVGGANGSAATAVAALCMAAGRAIAYSGLRLGVLLNILVTQYEIAKAAPDQGEAWVS